MSPIPDPPNPRKSATPVLWGTNRWGTPRAGGANQGGSSRGGPGWTRMDAVEQEEISGM